MVATDCPSAMGGVEEAHPFHNPLPRRELVRKDAVEALRA